MTTHLFPFLHEYVPPEFFASTHVKQILEAKTLNGSLPILSAIQLLLSCVSDSDELHACSEYELVAQYVNTLIRIKNDLKNDKNIIKFEPNKFGPVESKDFLESLDNYDFKSIKTLREWINFLNNFSMFRIHSRNIFKLKRDIDSKNKNSYSPISKRDQADKARQLIFKTLALIPEGEQKELLKVEKGKRGLKKEIRLLISEEDYKKFFDSNEKTFANRWSEVLPEIKPALLK